MTVSDDEPIIVPPVDQAELMLQAEALMPEPAPTFDKLVLNVASGDTMEKLFRKNNLNIGHLLSIAEIAEAKQRFRRIKPGDVFEVTHDNGEVISLYSELDLTSALRIERQESGFAAEIIERPIEIRKRMAHGIIDSSLFESATTAGLSDKVVMNIAGIFAWDVDFVLDIRQGDDYYVQYEQIWKTESSLRMVKSLQPNSTTMAALFRPLDLSMTISAVTTLHRPVIAFAKHSFARPLISHA